MTDSAEQEEKLHEWGEELVADLPNIASQLSDRSEELMQALWQ